LHAAALQVVELTIADDGYEAASAAKVATAAALARDHLERHAN
jgi:hypothetical protein